MSHNHSDHGREPKDFGAAFAVGIGLNIVYVLLEAGFGLYSGSLALIADAGHNLSDVFGLVIAWGAVWLARKPPAGRRTYGYRRTPILASLANAILLLIAVGAIAWESIRRLSDPQPVEFSTILWVAVAGIFVNGITTWLFASGSKDDLNIRGAFLHMAADTGVTAGVILAAIVIYWTGWTWVDPVVSLLIGIVIMLGTWGLLRGSVMLALDAVPSGVDLDAVRTFLLEAEGVDEIHDLHVWGLSTTETALTAHVVCGDATIGQRLLLVLPSRLHDHFGIDHSTLQIEDFQTAEHCKLRSDLAV